MAKASYSMGLVYPSAEADGISWCSRLLQVLYSCIASCISYGRAVLYCNPASIWSWRFFLSLPFGFSQRKEVVPSVLGFSPHVSSRFKVWLKPVFYGIGLPVS
ncbi:MAG: hypothetical protein WD426_12325 [Anditalea sp.]